MSRSTGGAVTAPFPLLPAVLRAAAVAGLLGAEYIHWAVIDVHAREWAPAGIFFTVIALAEVALAIGIGLTRRRAWLQAAVAVNLLTVGVWAMARTTGLPFGPSAGVPEAIGRADVIAAVLELLTVAAAGGLLLAGRHAVTPTAPASMARAPRHFYALAGAVVVYVVALTGFAMEPAVSGSLGHDDATGGEVLTLVASEFTFDTDRLSLVAGQPVELELRNRDALPHNVSVYRPDETKPLFRGEVVEARSTATYTLETPDPGEYEFRCDVHPAMTGVLEVSPGRAGAGRG